MLPLLAVTQRRIQLAVHTVLACCRSCIAHAGLIRLYYSTRSILTFLCCFHHVLSCFVCISVAFVMSCPVLFVSCTPLSSVRDTMFLCSPFCPWVGVFVIFGSFEFCII